ncbi:SDR family NAD(P)-dependent oxidoreductase [Paraburkholderia youngii]|uniref:SDR family NAD(P)-dependent oxidoreductase n=1 Tax=Paraburkholderia youngii TaxID=2782701 RepID=UPI003D24CA2F
MQDYTSGTKVALVTGAASGIGAAVCRRLARDGYYIGAVDANADGLKALTSEVSERTKIVFEALDVRDADAQNEFVKRVEQELGPISVAVPCAGVTRSGPAETMDSESWKLVMDVNVTGTFLTCQAVARPMLTRGNGSIVCVASISSKGGQPGRANYCASKFAVVGLVKSLAAEWANRGVRVNAVAPGVVETPLMLQGVPGDFQRVLLDRIPLKRFASPEEIAGSIALLLSEDASYINGAILEVDGGITAGYLTSKSGEDYGTRAPIQRINTTSA